MKFQTASSIFLTAAYVLADDDLNRCHFESSAYICTHDNGVVGYVSPAPVTTGAVPSSYEDCTVAQETTRCYADFDHDDDDHTSSRVQVQFIPLTASGSASTSAFSTSTAAQTSRRSSRVNDDDDNDLDDCRFSGTNYICTYEKGSVIGYVIPVPTGNSIPTEYEDCIEEGSTTRCFVDSDNTSRGIVQFVAMTGSMDGSTASNTGSTMSAMSAMSTMSPTTTVSTSITSAESTQTTQTTQASQTNAAPENNVPRNAFIGAVLGMGIFAPLFV